MNWLEILKVVGPAALGVLAKSPDIVMLIVHAIGVAEGLKGASGPEKKTKAIELVKDGAAIANAATQKTVIDPDEAAAIADSGIDAVVGAVNAVHKAKQAA